MTGPAYRPLDDAAQEAAQKAAAEKQLVVEQTAADAQKLGRALNPFQDMNAADRQAAEKATQEAARRFKEQERTGTAFLAASKASETQQGLPEPQRPSARVAALYDAREAMKGPPRSRGRGGIETPDAPAPGGSAATPRRTYNFRVRNQAQEAQAQTDARVEKSDRYVVKTAKLQITESSEKTLGSGAWTPGRGGRGKGGMSLGE